MELEENMIKDKKKGQVRLGIDIGGVIISKSGDDGEDTSFFGKNYLQTPPEPQVLESIATLVQHYGQQNVFLVSKCGENFQKKTLEWLKFIGFFEKTQMPMVNVRFCAERPQKAIICKELGITHFVDDRLDVLKHLIPLDTIENLYLYKPEDLKKQGYYLYFCPFITKVHSWESLTHILLD